MFTRWYLYRNAMNPQTVEKTTNAIADKNRLAILLELSRREVMSGHDAVELTGLSQPCVSHHIKLLAESGLVDTSKEGRCLQLRLNKPAIRALAAFLTGLV
jgi:ArsR family transcriptional regulator, arsenate/arsenite/antimonite-responsive transcriptional repressor